MRGSRIFKSSVYRDASKERNSNSPVYSKKSQLLTLLSLYNFKTIIFCLSKRASIRSRDMHEYETRGRDTYQAGEHRTVVFEHLASEVGG